MARIRGVFLRTPPPGPEMYSSKEAALVANPEMVVSDAAFPKNRLDSVKNAAFRVNSGSRGDWDKEEFFAIWEYAKDVVLRVRTDEDASGSEAASEDKGSVEVVGFVRTEKVDTESGRKKSVRVVIGDDDGPQRALDDVLKEDGVELGGWILLIGCQPHVPPGWESVVNVGQKRRRRSE